MANYFRNYNPNFYSGDTRITNNYYPYSLSQSKPVVINDYKKQQQMEYKAYLDMQVEQERLKKKKGNNLYMVQSAGVNNTKVSDYVFNNDKERENKLLERKRKEEYNKFLQQQIEEKKRRRELEKQKQQEYELKLEREMMEYQKQLNLNKEKNDNNTNNNNNNSNSNTKSQINNNVNNILNKPIRPYSNNINSKINLNLNDEEREKETKLDAMKLSFGAKYGNMQSIKPSIHYGINNELPVNRISNTKYNFFTNKEFEPNTIDVNLKAYNRTKNNFMDTNDMLNKLIESNFAKLNDNTNTYNNKISFEVNDSFKKMTFGNNNIPMEPSIRKVDTNRINSNTKERLDLNFVNDIDLSALEYRSKYENLDGTLKKEEDDKGLMHSMKSSSKLVTTNEDFWRKENEKRNSQMKNIGENIMRSSRGMYTVNPEANSNKTLKRTITEIDQLLLSKETPLSQATKPVEYKFKTSFSDYDKLLGKPHLEPEDKKDKPVNLLPNNYDIPRGSDKIYDEIKDLLSSKENWGEDNNKKVIDNSEDEIDKIIKKYANPTELVNEVLNGNKNKCNKENTNSTYKLIKKYNIPEKNAFKQTPNNENNYLKGNKEPEKENNVFQESKEHNFNIIQKKIIKEKVDNFQLQSQTKNEPTNDTKSDNQSEVQKDSPNDIQTDLPSILDIFDDLLVDDKKGDEKENLNRIKQNESFHNYKKKKTPKEDDLCNIRYSDEDEEKEERKETEEIISISASNDSNESKDKIIDVHNSTNKDNNDDFEEKMNFFGDSKYSNFNIEKRKDDKVNDNQDSKDKNRHLNLFDSMKESEMNDSYCDKIIKDIDKYRAMAHTTNDDKDN